MDEDQKKEAVDQRPDSPDALAAPPPPSPENPWVVESAVNGYAYLNQDARRLHDLALTAQGFDRTRFSRTAIILYVAALEGLINRATDFFLKPPLKGFFAGKGSKERVFSIEEKWRLLPMLLGKTEEFDTSDYPWTQFVELVRLRNDFLHPKSARKAYYRFFGHGRMEPLTWNDVPRDLKQSKARITDFIGQETLEYMSTSIPIDPYSIRPEHLDTAKRVCDAMVRRLDVLLDGRLRAISETEIPAEIESESWLHVDFMTVIYPPGAKFGSAGEQPKVPGTALPKSSGSAESGSGPSPAPATAPAHPPIENVAARLLQELAHLQSLIEQLAPQIAARRLSSADVQQDPWKVMLTSFAVKQLEHARSVERLQYTSDAGLIARSMLEGTALLTYVNSDPTQRDERARRWMEFDAVRTLREARRRAAIESGKDDSPVWEERRAETQKQIDEAQKELGRYGQKFLTDKARKAREEGRELPDDPYVPRWHEDTITDIFRKHRNGASLFLWEAFSQLHHFDARMFARSVQGTGDDLSFDLRRPESRATAVHCAANALQVVEVFLSQEDTSE